MYYTIVFQYTKEMFKNLVFPSFLQNFSLTHTFLIFDSFLRTHGSHNYRLLLLKHNQPLPHIIKHHKRSHSTQHRQVILHTLTLSI